MPADFAWSELAILCGTVVFGFGSALVPLLNAEAYVFAAQSSPRTAGTAVAVALALGQSAGKVALFLLARQGSKVAATRHRRRARRDLKAPGRLARLVVHLLGLVGSRRWGIPIVLLSAVVGLPPVYAVALLAGASRMSLWCFAPLVLVGRIVRFALLAVGVNTSFAGLFD